MISQEPLRRTPLGRQTEPVSVYAPGLLFPVSRKAKREEIGLGGSLPFRGWDIWTAYEVSWLNRRGRPEVAMADIRVPCESENLIESKSLKLYLNSLCQTGFEDAEAVRATVKADLSAAAGAEVSVSLILPEAFERQRIGQWEGVCLDGLDVDVDRYTVQPAFLAAGGRDVEERLFSHLLKSNCPVTGQPDWGSVWFHYTGRQIDREGLLKYLISFREHQEFHEHCAERMFTDILERCRPERLTVYARYTRRGGLDINPFRSNFEDAPENVRLARQ